MVILVLCVALVGHDIVTPDDFELSAEVALTKTTFGADDEGPDVSFAEYTLDPNDSMYEALKSCLFHAKYHYSLDTMMEGSTKENIEIAYDIFFPGTRKVVKIFEDGTIAIHNRYFRISRDDSYAIVSVLDAIFKNESHHG